MVPVRLQVETTAALQRLLNFDTCLTNIIQLQGFI